MKKVLCGVMCNLLLLSVCAGCAGREPASFQPAQTVQTLMDSGAFSETLEKLDPALLFSLPGGAEDYEDSVLFYSTGATAETAAVIAVSDAEQADEVETALHTWVEGQLEAERGYRPAEAEKLEHAIVEKRGLTVLLVVAADWEKAAAAVPAE